MKRDGVPMCLMVALLANAARADLVSWYTFDEARTGASLAADGGAAPRWDGKFYGIATRTTRTPGNASKAALDLTASGAGSVGTVDSAGTANDCDKADTLAKMTLTYWLNLQGAPSANMHILGNRTQPGVAGGDGWWNAGFTSVGGVMNMSRFRLTFGVGSNNNSADDVIVYTDGIGSAAGNGNPWSASNKWLFVAITYDSTVTLANCVKFHLGNETTSVTALTGYTIGGIAPVVPGQNTTDLRIGIDARFNTDAARKVAGFLDSVRIYNAVLTSSELEAIRKADLKPPSGGTAVLVR